MSFERLQSNDRRLVVVALVVIIVSALYIRSNYSAAFPQASIDLRYSRDEITAMAENFLRDRGLSSEGFRNLTLFEPDDDARLYLEREMGLEEANRLMQREVSVWRWRARWFRPPEKEEMIVFLSPDGRTVGFRHEVPEAAPGARLEKNSARVMALEFLQARTEAPHRLVEEQLQERPNRFDYIFTWEQEGFRVKDASYRRRVVVKGEHVGEYSEYLHVPEQWQRDYAALRSSNELYFWIAQALYIVLILAAMAALMQSLRRRQILWRPLILLSGAVGVLTVINEWNLLPFLIDSMPTSTPYRETLLLGLLQGLGAGVGYFLYVILGAAPGEALYRASYPSRLSLPAAISRRGIRTKEFFLASVTGYGFAAAHIAFVVAFYLIGRKFGAWTPQDVEYSNVLSTALPWLYPLTIAVLASASEEFWFRLLAIPLLKRYLRSTWIAVLAPAFIWGFLHANYPQQPGFIRGVEVGVIGVAAGFLMLRFGILSTLIWHYTVDAFLISTVLLQADSWLFRLSGVAVSGAVLLPLAISLVHYRRNGGFLVDSRMQNASSAPVPAPEAPAPARAGPAAPLPARRRLRWLYVLAVLAVAAGLLLRPVRFGEFVKVHISASEAVDIADHSLRENNIDPASWRRAVQFVPNLYAADFEYVRRLDGSSAANEIVRDRTFTGVWYVRYLRPMQNEEWRVFVDQQGRVYRKDHVLDEKAPGARLSPGQARQLAERHLAESQRLPVGEYHLVDSSEEKLDNRTDHKFVWEDRGFRRAEVTARVSLSVVGDEVSSYRRFLKLPEQWLREFHRPRLRRYLVPALSGAIGLPLLIVFIRRLSGRQMHDRHHYRWKTYVVAGAAAAVLSALEQANQWPGVLAAYNTAEPLENYVGQTLLARLVLVLVAGLGIFLLVMAADVFLQLAVGYRALPRPSLLRAATVALLAGGFWRALSAMEQLIPGDRLALSLWGLTGPDTFLPAFAVVNQSLFSAVALLCSAVILGAGVVRFLRNRTGYIVITVVVAVAALSGSTNAWQWMFHFLEGAALIGLVWFLVETCGADIAGFGVAVFWLEAVRRGADLVNQPAPALHWSGVAALVAAALLGTVLLAGLQRRACDDPR